jgi:tRNA 5-methylaminomethyl-2-thiouridine biosynthesis bifunctional protein
MAVVRASDKSRNLKVSLNYGGSFSSCFDNRHGIGSTFGRHDNDISVKPEDTAEVIARLASALPEIAEGLEPEFHFAAMRSASRDRQPVAGQVFDSKGQIIPGMFASIAHGSKGASTCLFAGEIIAAKICGEALPINESLYSHNMSPERFHNQFTRAHKQAINKTK